MDRVTARRVTALPLLILMALLVGASPTHAAPAQAPAAPAPVIAPAIPALPAKAADVRYVTASYALNIRAGAGTNTRIIGVLKRSTKITVSQTAKAGRWGKLVGRSGWVALAYTSKKRPGTGGTKCQQAARSVLGSNYSWACVHGLPHHGLTNIGTGHIQIRDGLSWSQTAAVARHERAHVNQVVRGQCSAACRAYVTRWAGARDFMGAGLPTSRRPVEILAWSAARCAGGEPSYERRHRHLSCTSLQAALRLR